MTSDLCEEDVVQIESPQILSASEGAAGGEGVAVGGGRVQASSAAVELGRRLLLAARAGDTAAVLDLMAKGAPFTTDWLGTSPLHLAAANAHTETCAVLLRAGVSRDARTKVERTPLHLAAHAGHAAVVALLLDHGALVDCRDMLRMTPLHWAAARGHAAAARALLRRGADVRARCKFKHTPRSLAARYRHRALVALLQRAEEEADQMTEAGGKAVEVEVDSITKVPEIKVDNKTKLQEELLKTHKADEKVEQQQQQQQQAAAARLLRRHGITLLPADDGSTVLNAMQSGRTVVLSDVGKLMLKESSGAPPSPDAGVSGGVAGSAGGVAGAGGVSGGAGVVLTATPVRSPPRGVKVFTLNNKLLAPAKPPVKKIINPHELQQMKFVQLSSECKAVSPVRVCGAGGVGGVGARRGGRGARPAVKIIVNKSNLSKLINSAATTAATGATSVAMDTAALPNGLEEARRLRAELAAARAALADVTAELRACRDRLRVYEQH